MTAAQRKAMLERVEKISQQVRNLVVEDYTSPPDWRPFVAELADEVLLICKLLNKPARKKVSGTNIVYRRGAP